jgi:N-methylhydantoinase A
LDPASVEAAVLRLRDCGVQSLAISLLWSFVNPAHEKAVEEIARRLAPGLFITKGSDVAPFIGEYERTATAAMNAYLSDVARGYLARLMEKLEEEGFQAPLLVTQGHGGALQGEAAVRNVVGMMESGPASGMVASRFVGSTVKSPNIIATDMGGTTFKVGLITDGRFEHAIDPHYSRYNVQVPKIDIRSIGAGGGTIAYIDKESGALRIGPQSAGAVPGPSCYGFGGEDPTVTDADLVLGYLNPDFFLGGRMRLNRKAAEEAIGRKVARTLGLSVVQAAAGIYKIACSHSADLIRKISIERGYDPGDFVLFAYGGAGPVHAGMYAQQLGVPRILVPFTASVHCAMGAVCSDIVREYGQSDPMRLPADPDRINVNFEKLEARASDDFRSDRIEGDGVEIRRFIDLKFRRQVHVVRVTVPTGTLAEQDLSRLLDEFQSLYEKRYGRGSAYRGAGVEIVSFGVEAVRRLPKPNLQAYPMADHIPGEALAGKRVAYFVDIENPAAPPSVEKATPVYRLPGLLPGNSIPGPAIIETPVTTIVLQPGQRAGVDAYLNVTIEVR